MNAIDFDGDQQSGEYGIGTISGVLEALVCNPPR